MSNKNINTLLVSLLFIAAFLRLFHPLQIPYTYDELSALSRTYFNSFSDLINKGIIIDGHPAGVQVFIYYWTRLFGYTEIVVKLPFIITGILSVYFIFKIGKAWFNPTVGLICAAYIATLEYPIMYSQIIRPYTSGLFFCLAMVYYWNNLIFSPSQKTGKNLILYVLLSALCAYNHHFSLLFAGIVGVTGLFFIQKKHLVHYIIAGLSIFVLYIPHLRIFFYQLHHGGIGGTNGWLGKPENTFIIDYLKYAFQFSFSISCCVVMLLLYGIYNVIRSKKANTKFLVISLCWFTLPILIGFLYSVFINPVLQYSMLLFSFPFLLLFLFGLLPQLPLKTNIVLLFFICTINIFSLVHTRQYYNLFYKAPYEQPIVVHDSLVHAIGKENYTAILQTEDSDKFMTDYYVHKDHADTSFYKAKSLGCLIARTGNYARLISFMKSTKGAYFAFGGTAGFDPTIIQIVNNYYPNMVKRWNFYDASMFLFSNKPADNLIPEYSFESTDRYEGASKYWSDASASMLNDSIYFAGKHSYTMDATHEWAPGFSCKLSDMSWNRNDIIDVSLELYPLDTMTDVSIVSSLEKDGKVLYWRETKVDKFIPDSVKNTWVKVYHSLKLQDIHDYSPDLLLKVYIWNRGKKRFYMDNFSVKTFKGNPIIYGLMEKI